MSRPPEKLDIHRGHGAGQGSWQKCHGEGEMVPSSTWGSAVQTPPALGGPLWTCDSLALSTCPNSSVPPRSSHGAGGTPYRCQGPRVGNRVPLSMERSSTALIVQ